MLGGVSSTTHLALLPNSPNQSGTAICKLSDNTFAVSVRPFTPLYHLVHWQTIFWCEIENDCVLSSVRSWLLPVITFLYRGLPQQKLRIWGLIQDLLTNKKARLTVNFSVLKVTHTSACKTHSKLHLISEKRTMFL